MVFNSIGYNADGIYYHYIKDHIGNINAVVNSAADTLVQATIYYASGVPMVESHDIPPTHYNAYGVQPNQNFGRDEQPYLYNGKEFIEAHGLNEYDSQARMYYATIMRTTTMDPLADKYPHISPYAYCSWNPVRFVDPDGREKINLMDGDTEDVIQCNLFEGAVNFNEYDKRDSHIFFFSHGNSTEMYPSNSEQPMSAKDFIAYISANSDVWKNTEDKSSLTIVLLSCETGKGENSLAQQISQLLPETTIIAPTELVVNSALNEESIIYGTAETYYLPDVKDHSCWGKWKTYKNGLLINTSPNGNIRYVYTEVPSNP